MKYLLFVCIILFSAISTFAQSETEKGVNLYRNGNFNQAITVLESVVKTDKKNRKAWMYLGASYFKTGNRKEATKAFKKASSVSLSEKEEKEAKDGLAIKLGFNVPYTDSAKENSIQGTVKIAVEFGENGAIKFAYVVQGLPYGLTDSCLEAVKKFKFEPGQKNGKPVPVVSIIEYSFDIH